MIPVVYLNHHSQVFVFCLREGRDLQQHGPNNFSFVGRKEVIQVVSGTVLGAVQVWQQVTVLKVECSYVPEGLYFQSPQATAWVVSFNDH
jgi:hypothetical protein